MVKRFNQNITFFLKNIFSFFITETLKQADGSLINVNKS